VAAFGHACDSAAETVAEVARIGDYLRRIAQQVGPLLADADPAWL
jgi:hypothetical protein